jgi:hypothetical protein
LAVLPVPHGKGVRTSPVNCLGHSSMQTRGRFLSRLRVYTAQISSVAAANPAFPSGGIHHS